MTKNVGNYFVYKSDLTGTEENLLHIQDNIYYVPKKTINKFLDYELLSKPDIYDLCNFIKAQIRYDGLHILNIMGFSTQMVMRQSFVVDKFINNNYFNHHKIELKDSNDFIFKLSQMEYNVWFCLNYYKNHGPEHKPYSLYVFEFFYRHLNNGILNFSRLKEPVSIDIDKILSYSDEKVKNQWNLLIQWNLESFNELSKESKLAYYLFKTDAKDYIYEKFYDRQYGDMIQEIDNKDIDYILAKLTND